MQHRRTGRVAPGPAAATARTAGWGLLLVLTACSGPSATGVPPGSPATAPPTASASVAPAASGSAATASSSTGSATAPAATVGASPGGPATASTCAATTLAGLTAVQRVGQLFVLGVPLDDPAGRPAALAAASAVAAGGYLLQGRSAAGVTAVRQLTADLTPRLARSAAGVAPFVAVDQEGGQIQALSGPGFSTIPSGLQQGALPVATLRERATTWGGQLHRAGVNVDFAPVLDVVPAAVGRANQPIGRYDRELGHTPEAVTEHGVAVVEGLAAAGIAATAKHFPGLGRADGNTDEQAGVSDTVTTADDPTLRPFAAAVAAGVPLVMVSTAVYSRIDPSSPAAFSPAVIAVLRDRLHFTGLVAADDLGQAAQVAAVPAGQRALRFLAAGGQVVVVVRPPSVARSMAAAVVAATTTDPVVRRRVDAAALQVLTTKVRLGLLACR